MKLCYWATLTRLTIGENPVEVCKSKEISFDFTERSRARLLSLAYDATITSRTKLQH